ncbi:MAG: hypothetical protein VX730_07040 [Pseudomonadota bacterium]|nr:hypothetical protein [Pseudomonadota bacterium]
MRKHFVFALFVVIAAVFAAFQFVMPAAWWGPTALATMLCMVGIAMHFIFRYNAESEVGLFLVLAGGFGASTASWIMPGFMTCQAVWMGIYMTIAVISAFMAVYKSGLTPHFA